MIALWLTAITLVAYVLSGVRLLCFQRNGARYRLGFSLLASALIAASIYGIIEIMFYASVPTPSQTVMALVVCVLSLRGRGNVASMLRSNQ